MSVTGQESIRSEISELETQLFSLHSQRHTNISQLFDNELALCSELERISNVVDRDKNIADKSKEKQIRLSNLLSKMRWKHRLVISECENNPDREMAYELWDWSQADLLWQSYSIIQNINRLLIQSCLVASK